ncbi:MAG TPA: histidinol-phosphate transaminase [Candidatus Kryptonia bacterium]|nr:histidinol-phosphate transaminase [Candidatus Kryptonia bacterium]
MDLTQLVPDWIRNLAAYPPGMPIEELEREYGIYDSIKLASNENPLGPSPKALAAVTQALPQMHRYPDGGCFYLKRALAQKLGVVPESLIFGNGSNEIIELLVRTFMARGEHAVVADQAFVIYRMIVQAAGGRSTIVPLRNFTHDLEAMAEAITPATRLVFLANPNNPTGTIFFRAQWREFLAAVPERVIIVLDEAYAEFVEDSEYPDALADLAANRLLVVLRTFSKIYGLAALRIGYGIGRPELIELVNRVRQPFNVGTLAQVGAMAALDDTAHVEATRRVNREGLKYLRAECERLGVTYVPSWANFLLINVGNGMRVYERLLREGVIVRPMGFYGLPEHVRVTVGLPPENERFVAALAKVLREGGAGGAPF